MEMHIRSNNLKIRGIEKIDNIQQDQVELSVCQHLTNNLSLDGDLLDLNA
jgi:hypothetical protein